MSSLAFLLAASCGESSSTANAPAADGPAADGPAADAPAADVPTADAPAGDAPATADATGDAGLPDDLGVDAALPDASVPRICERVSVSTAGVQTGGNSYFSGSAGVHRYVSGDGQFVTFQSEGGGLVADDVDGWTDIFLRDRAAGAATTTRVSVTSAGMAGGGLSNLPSISDDGRFVAFHSASATLVAADGNGFEDVFVHDSVSQTTERVSLASDETEANCGSFHASLSGDGRYVAFQSCATNWSEVAGKTVGVSDVFVRDRTTGTTVLASPHPLGTGPGQWDHHSGDPVLSADGRKVAFESRSDTLVAKGGNASTSSEIYLRDLDAGTTEWISVHAPVAGQPDDSFHPSLSADGRFVAFESLSTNQVAGDTNDDRDIFVRDRQLTVTERANLTDADSEPQELGLTTCQGSQTPSISDDGRFVAFQSCADNLVPADTNIVADIFVRDRMLATTGRVTADDGTELNSSSGTPSLSADGQWVAFFSGASNLIVPDTNGSTYDFYLCPAP